MDLPNDTALEAAVLGALLLEPRHVADVRAILPDANVFTDERNAALYRIILDRDDRGESADLVTVTLEAKAKAIPVAYPAGLTSSVGSGVEVLNHARQLADLEMRRRMILFATELMARAHTDADAAEWATARLDEITGATLCVDTARPIGDVLADTLRELERRQQAHREGHTAGIPAGLASLDRATGGWRGGQLIVLGARPAMGKTAVSLLFARAAAAAGVPVCIFSLEMPDTQLAGRMLVGASDTDAGAFRAGTVTTEQWRAIECGAAELNRLPIYLVDTASISMPRVRAMCRAMQRRQRCGMVVIDYLQLIETQAGRRDNREREVAGISRAAKLLAKELDVPVILLAQLSRKVEERADKTPVLADLRESGSIEQDADVVLFIDRPAYYGIEQFEAGRLGMVSSRGVGRLHVAKNREGSTGTVLFRHNESLTQIVDYGVPTGKTESAGPPL